MNADEGNPDSPAAGGQPTDFTSGVEPPIALPVLAYAAPEAGFRRRNRRRVLPAMVIFSSATYGWCLIAAGCLWVIRSEIGSNLGQSFMDILMGLSFLSLFLQAISAVSCFLRASFSSIRLEIRTSACWLGPLFFIAGLIVIVIAGQSQFVIADIADLAIVVIPGQSQFLGLNSEISFIFGWFVSYPLICGWLLLRPAGAARGSNP